MKRQPVDSSNIISAAYSKEKKILEVEFPKGNVYQYFKIPVRLYNSMMKALSIGAYFNAHIRNAGYKFKKIR